MLNLLKIDSAIKMILQCYSRSILFAFLIRCLSYSGTKKILIKKLFWTKERIRYVGNYLAGFR